MLELLDIRFSYLCRASHLNNEGKSPIILRVIYRGERRDIFTGLYCCKENWDAESSRVSLQEKSAATINKNLKVIKYKAMDAFQCMKFSGAEFTLDELLAKLKGKEAKPVLLIDFLRESSEHAKKRVGVDISQTTYLKYRRSLQHMQEFLLTEYKVRNYPLARIDNKFLEKYFFYLRNSRKNSHNSAFKSMQLIKAILFPAIKSGVIKNDPFVGLKVKQKKILREFLTQEEMDLIGNLKITSADLSRVRHIFLFSCYTGLAYTDLKQLCGHHIILDNEKNYYIRKARQKTGEESIIPLLPPAIRIFEKYRLTGKLQDFNWYMTSNQKMNFRLKVIGEKAGIHKTLHMHLARHTFATTVTLSNGIPIETVSKMLGHASIKQTQLYAKVVAEKVKYDMLKLSSIYK